ncbi:MAG TPA: hypothetical protein VF278_11300 [Pirellulales bacterium]
MKFALLGCDHDTLQLATAIARDPAHALVWAHDLSVHGPALRAAAPGLLVAEHWEGLLGETIADVVLVARAADQQLRTDQLRKLAQVGVPMLVSHPVVDSMLVYYELDMIRQEGRARMAPFLLARWHPAWRRLAALIAAGESGSLGMLEQVVIEHSAAGRDRAEVLSAFVSDMELARPFCGLLDKVSAMTSTGVRTAAETINYATLSVQMSSPANLLVRWSLTGAGDERGRRFILIGTKGRATLWAPHSGCWNLQSQLGGSTESEEFAEVDLAAAALPSLAGAIRGKAPAADPEAGALPSGLSDWLDACGTMELADAAQHSIERGRAIELHYEAPTEHATFKGLMSGIGCLLLVAGLFVLVIATTAVHAGVPLAGSWPYVLLGVLVVFLLLQLLRLVFPSQ